LGFTLLTLVTLYWASGRLYSQLALRVFAERLAPDAQAAIPSGENPERVDFSSWSAGRVKAYEDSLRVEKEAPIAVLMIESIHLKVPVFAGTSDLILDRGAGWIPRTASPGENGNIGIAGHRDGFFRALKSIAAGDRIELITLNAVDTYVVERTEIVAPDDVGVLRSSERPKITLVTCYPFYFIGSAPQRFIVEAVRVARESPQPERIAARIMNGP
jgi:sortase A